MHICDFLTMISTATIIPHAFLLGESPISSAAHWSALNLLRPTDPQRSSLKCYQSRCSRTRGGKRKPKKQNHLKAKPKNPRLTQVFYIHCPFLFFIFVCFLDLLCLKMYFYSYLHQSFFGIALLTPFPASLLSTKPPHRLLLALLKSWPLSTFMVVLCVYVYAHMWLMQTTQSVYCF